MFDENWDIFQLGTQCFMIGLFFLLVFAKHETNAEESGTEGGETSRHHPHAVAYAVYRLRPTNT
jgi:hypothetical protein